MAKGIINEQMTKIAPIDVSAKHTAGAILGWNGEKYIEAVASTSESKTGTSTGVSSWTLKHGDLIHGLVTIKVNGSSTHAYTFDYGYKWQDAVVTFGAALTSADTATAQYSYFIADPSAILMEDVSTSANPAEALVEVYGIAYNATDNEDIKARLEKNGIFVTSQVSA